jgi:hypothetical protein
MKNKCIILPLFVTCFYLPNLMALEMGVGAKTMGQVVEVGQKLGNSFNVRLAVASNYESGEVEYSSSDKIEVDSVLSGDIGQWNVSHSSLLIDYNPWKGNFRLTLGLTDSSLTWLVVNSGVESYIINGNPTPRNIVDSTELEIQFTDGISPYLGMGWASGFDKEKGFSFNGDIGVIATSDFLVLFDASCVAGQIFSSECEQVKEDVKQELNDLQSEEELSLLPLLGLGISYKF